MGTEYQSGLQPVARSRIFSCGGDNAGFQIVSSWYGKVIDEWHASFPDRAFRLHVRSYTDSFYSPHYIARTHFATYGTSDGWTECLTELSGVSRIFHRMQYDNSFHVNCKEHRGGPRDTSFTISQLINYTPKLINIK